MSRLDKVPRLSKGQVLSGARREAFNRAVLAAYKDGCSIRDIERQSGSSYGRIHRILKKEMGGFRRRGNPGRGSDYDWDQRDSE